MFEEAQIQSGGKKQRRNKFMDKYTTTDIEEDAESGDERANLVFHDFELRPARMNETYHHPMPRGYTDQIYQSNLRIRDLNSDNLSP